MSEMRIQDIGPPLVLVATIARVFPASVSEYNFLASASGLALEFSSAVIVAHCHVIVGTWLRKKEYTTFFARVMVDERNHVSIHRVRR